MTDLCARFPEIVRARNARLIMSNVIPDADAISGSLPQDEESAGTSTTPYCIWHPDFATQDTYRELVRRFPAMRYQVGRACAAAGFEALYDELDLLPEFDNGWPPGAPMPFMIWWPRRPREWTLDELAEKVPQMREQVAIASVICDYPGLYKKLNAKPTSYLWLSAKLSPNSFYLKDIEARAAEQNIKLEDSGRWTSERFCLVPDFEPTDDDPPVELHDCVDIDLYYCSLWAPDEAGMLQFAPIERYVWASAELLRTV